jgi:signal transduction histidine kinase
MRIAPSLLEILQTPNVDANARTFLQWAVEATETPNPSLYLLSTQRSAYLKFAGAGGDLYRKKDVRFSERTHIVAKRGNAVIGFLEWSENIHQLASQDRESACAFIEELYRRIYVQNFFSHVRKPVDFTNQDTYFRDTAKLLSDTLSMEIVAIRQINESNSLYCVAFYRYPGEFDSRVDFEGDKLPPPFLEVIDHTRKVLAEKKAEALHVQFETVDSQNIERYGFLLDDPLIAEVRTFTVFPIVYGDEFFGVASCATTVPFQFSTLERTTIETAMQLIGVAIGNFTRYHEVKRMADVIHDQLFSITELEIAQSARHELQNIEAEQALLFDELQALIRRANVRDAAIGEVISKLHESLDKLSATIVKLRYSGVHAAPKLGKTSVKKIWDEATDLMKQRLKMMDIRTRYVGPELEGYYYSDWLREAFLNLLFNSIDAFRERPKQNRSIMVVANKESPASLFNLLDYSDTAGGIAFSRLTIPDPIREANPNMGPEQLIFQPKVTSKKNRKSAGWGLYLVRQALRVHRGSVSLRATTKEGTTFRIQIRKDLEKLEG